MKVQTILESMKGSLKCLILPVALILVTAPTALQGQTTYTGKFKEHKVTIEYTSSNGCGGFNPSVKDSYTPTDAVPAPFTIALPSSAPALCKSDWSFSPFKGTLTISSQADGPLTWTLGTGYPTTIELSAKIIGDWTVASSGVFDPRFCGFLATAMIAQNEANDSPCPKQRDAKAPPFPYDFPLTYHVNIGNQCKPKAWHWDAVGTGYDMWQTSVLDVGNGWWGSTDPNQAVINPRYRVYVTIETHYSFTPSATAPSISLNPTSLDFGSLTDNPAPKTVTLTNIGGGTLSWQAAASPSTWLSVAPASSSLGAGQNATLSVSVKADSLSSGANSGTITVTSVNASNSPQKVTVTATRADMTDSVVLSGESPPGGTVLPAESSQGFSAKVKYTLGSKPTAKLSLRVLNQDGVLRGAADFLDISRSDGTKETTMTIPAFTIDKSDTSLKLKASIIYSSTTILAESNAVSYTVGAKKCGKVSAVGLWAGGDWMDRSKWRSVAFSWFYGASNLQRHAEVGSGLTVLDGTLGVQVHYDACQTGRLKLYLQEKKNDGTSVREPAILGDYLIGSGTDQNQYFWLPPDAMVPRDADIWSFRASLVQGEGSDPILSDSLDFPIYRLHIVPKGFAPSNPSSARLTKRDTVKFSFDIEYNLGQASIDLWAVLDAANGISCFEKGTVECGTKIKYASQISGSGKITFPFDYQVPDNARGVAVIFADCAKPGDCKIKTEWVLYPNIQAPVVTIPAAVGQVASALGMDAKTVQNYASQAVKYIRTARDFSSSGLFKLASGPAGLLPQAAIAPGENQAADSFQNLIGINAFWQVDPPVPATNTTPFGGGTATFDVTLHYTAGDLPDNPNFKESNLKVVSYDTATGKLTSYDTVVDIVNKTLTARMDGLGPYISAGVLGPFTSQGLDFPVLRSTDSIYNGLGMLNLGMQAATLSLTAYSEDGSTKSGTSVTNPATATLGPGQQIPKLAQQFFNFPQTSSNNGWVQVRSDKNTVVGFELIGSDTVLDGADVSGTHSPSVVLTDIEYDSTATTEIHIANPSNFPISVTIELHTNSPTAVGSLDVSLMPKEKLSRRIQDLFPSITRPFLGYLLISADHNILASEILTSDTSIAVLNARSLVSGTSTASRLYSAQLAHGVNAYYTRFNIVNPTSLTAQLVIRAVNDSGSSLATPVSVSLGPGQQYLRDVGVMFGLGSASLLTGSIIVDSSITGVVGDVSFGDPTSKATFRTSLPLDSNPSKFAAFAQVANGAGYFTGFAAFNPNTTAAAADLKIYKSDGSLTGTSRFTLPAGGRLSKLLPQVVSISEGQVGGYFTLTSDQPLTSFAVFGTTTLSALSAVPPLGRDSSTSSVTPPDPCNLLSVSFDGATGWMVIGNVATWQIVNGKYEVSGISANYAAEVEHTIPAPNYFRLTMDVEAQNFNGSFYGFEPFSDSQTFTLSTTSGTRHIDGLGAAVNNQGQAAFLAYDVDNNNFLILSPGNYGTVTSIGVEWTGAGVSLLVNGVVQKTIAPGSFGVTSIPAPNLNVLGLYATGTTSRVRFDNICQKNP